MSVEVTCHACGEEFDARHGVCPVCGDQGGHPCPHIEVKPTVSATTSAMAIQIMIFGFKCVKCGKQWDIGEACESFVKITRLEEMYENERRDCLERQGTIRELREKIAQLEEDDENDESDVPALRASG